MRIADSHIRIFCGEKEYTRDEKFIGRNEKKKDERRGGERRAKGGKPESREYVEVPGEQRCVKEEKKKHTHT